MLPQFYLANEYAKATLGDPLTPLPLPVDEFVERTRTSLKLVFSQMLLFRTVLWAGKVNFSCRRFFAVRTLLTWH
jgi:hypothetical protein